jgi:hypothetical protein
VDVFLDQGAQNYEFIPTGITSIGGLELEICIKQDDYVRSVDRFGNLQSFEHNSLHMQPKLMNFGQSASYEVPELLQLDLPQSEVHSPRYKIMKVTRSAEFTDSESSNVSSIAPGICTG